MNNFVVFFISSLNLARLIRPLHVPIALVLIAVDNQYVKEIISRANKIKGEIMKMIKLTLFLTLVSVVLLCQSTNAGSIEDYCRRIVGESYSLMETCINQEREARRGVTGKATEPRIKTYCQRIVGDSFSLQETCIQQEEQAKSNIARMSVSARVLNYCKRIVGESYALMETCIQQEQGAKSRLGY